MLDPTQRIVAYLRLPPGKEEEALPLQNQHIQEFITAHPGTTLLKTFIESGDSHSHRWPVLKEAVNFSLEHHAHLLIAEIKNLTHNDAFSKQIIRFIHEGKHEVHCCDQPFITRDNFEVLVAHATEQKKIHGQLIKAGLSRTNAKSGNPHANEVISKVNKPKIENAVLFALMLQPVIEHYRKHQFSQRKMVAALNEEGFNAPEGGHWVLSQLQKVLDRMNINNAALTLDKKIQDYQALGYDNVTMVDILNKTHIPSPKGTPWTHTQLEKVQERVEQLNNIIQFNELCLELAQLLEGFHIDEVTDAAITTALTEHNLPLPPEPITEVHHNFIARLQTAMLCKNTFWDNPKYAQRSSSQVTETLHTILKQMQLLSQTSEAFLTLSYSVDNQKAYRS